MATAGLARGVLYEAGMKSPQFVAGCAWVLSGLLMSVPAAADQGGREGHGPSRQSWMHKLDRGLQRIVDGGAHRGRKTRVIIRTRPGAQAALAT